MQLKNYKLHLVLITSRDRASDYITRSRMRYKSFLLSRPQVPKSLCQPLLTKK